ncbi:MAG: PD-(D/E)XK nuclease family protein [Proteobacteria bacterium]|nr:PD-(D/E)XK nuclease family protein [Pseudomonadota bacterium]
MRGGHRKQQAGSGSNDVPAEGEQAAVRRVVACAADAHARLRRAAKWLQLQDRARPLLVVAATLDAGKEILRQVVADHGATFGWRATTLPHLGSERARTQLAARGLCPIGRLACEAVVARVVHDRIASGRLGRHATVARTPGFIRALTSTLLELRSEHFVAAQVAAADAELARLQCDYETELERARLADWPAVLRAAMAEAPEPERSAPLLLLDVPVRWSCEALFLETVGKHAACILATVPRGDERTSKYLHDALGLSESDAEPAPRTSALQELREHLFEDRRPGRIGLDNSVTILSAPGENRECVEITRCILRLSEQGTPFDRIAVLLRSPNEYRPHLQEALARAEIPAFFARGVVRPDPAGRAFLALLRCAQQGMSARRFAEYLSLAQVPDADESGQPPPPAPSHERWIAPDQELVPWALETEPEARLDEERAESIRTDDEPRSVTAGTLRAPRRWERLIVDASVIGGIDRWRRRLDGLARQMRGALREIDDSGEARQEQLRRNLEDLGALRAYALPLIEDLQGLAADRTWEGWLRSLGALASRALRRADRVLSVLSELAPMGPVGPVGLGEVMRVLEHQLLDLRVPPSGTRYGKLLVAPIAAARGLAFDVVFVPGLAEKLFPRKIVEDPLLLDRRRAILGAGLSTNEDRLAEERLALRVAAGTARKRIVLSYPRIDLEQGRPRVPSFYALEAVRAAEGKLPLFDEFAERTETVTAARVGWPAPNDRNDSIDESEYDLAVLESLLDQNPDKTLGSARYLLSSNAHLARALRFRARRWLPKWTGADGLWQPSTGATTALASHRLEARSFSPTALQAFAVCPYRFFLHTVHRLAPRDEPVAIEELDPLQRGSLVHDVQFELLSLLRDAGMLPLSRANVDAALERLGQVLDRVAAKYRDDLAPAIERVWQDGVASVAADLREWLRRASEDVSSLQPWRFELSFGLKEPRARDPASVEAPVELASGLRLRGSVDLIERDAAGVLRVTDHKTGKVRVEPGAIIDGGKALQPVLYALAVEKLFPDLSVRSGRLYYCTVAGGFVEREVRLDDKARAAAQTLADTVGTALEQGAFPAFPEPGACEWCDYRRVCGPYEELRTRRKPPGPLESLRQLRGLR